MIMNTGNFMNDNKITVEENYADPENYRQNEIKYGCKCGWNVIWTAGALGEPLK